MEYNQFKQLLDLKGIREKETVSLLKDFIEKFPYCHTSRLLYAKALHDQNNIHFDQHLKLAAAYATNRDVLRKLIASKTEEVEFEFPLSKKEEPAQEIGAVGNYSMVDPVQKPEIRSEEWYSEEEISGEAFEKQKEKEKPVDPHAVIRQRLSEILGSGPKAPATSSQITTPEKIEPGVVPGTETIKNQNEVIVPEELIPAPQAALKADPEETVFKEDILAEKKLEEELLNPAPEKSNEEKEIVAMAEKARDVLDKMELEHALEESILESLEKLPVIAPQTAANEKIRNAIPKSAAENGNTGKDSSNEVNAAWKDTARTFTDWLKAINSGSAPGFVQVHSPHKQSPKEAAQVPPFESEDAENQLSDDELIEKFLLEDPKIIPSRTEFYSPVSQAKKSVMDHDDVVSETLAQIYLKQGNLQKARWCYEKLILLHPEKSAFFAALLKEIPEGT